MNILRLLLPAVATAALAPAQRAPTRTFDEHGARLAVASPTEQVALTFRLTDWGRAGQAVATPPRAVGHDEHGAVVYRHAGIVERYRETADGFEQSFVIAARPAGEGDLVLGVAVHGDARAEATTARHGALTFRRGGADALRYGAAFAFGHGDDLTPIATRYDGAGRIELIVPAALVDGASYPLTVDPAIGNVTTILPYSAADVAPDVAHSPANGMFLTVFQRNAGGGSSIHGQVRTLDGTVPVSSVVTIASSGTNPTVCYTENLGQPGWCVAWEDDDRIEYRFLSATGGALTGTYNASSPAAGERHRRPTISGMAASGVLVAWDHTPAGANNPTEIQLRQLWPSTSQPGAGGPVRTLRSVTSGGYVQRARLPKSHATVDASGATWVASRATWDRWYDLPAPGDFDVESAAFRATAFSLAGTFVLTDGPGLIASTIGVSEKSADIGLMASTGDDPSDESFLIAYEVEPGDVVARFFDFQNATSTLFTVRGTAAYQGAPAVGVGACEWFVGYSEINGPNEFDIDLYAAWIRPDGTIMDDHSLVAAGNGVFQDGLRASAHPLLDGGERTKNGVQFAFRSQTGSGGGLDDVRLRFFQPVGVDAANTVPGCPSSGGVTPVLTTLGNPWAGNVDWKVQVNDNPPNTIVMLMIGVAPVSVPIPGAPGCTLYPQLPLVAADLQISLSDGGTQFSVPMPCYIPPGASLYFQGAAYDPAANALGWITSNGRRVEWDL